MHAAALDKLRPGEDLCEANAAMIQVLRRYYRDGEARTSRLAHGLGYSYEDPVVTLAFPNPWDVKPGCKPDPVEIRPGMLMELHPNLFVPDVAGAMIGDMVLVTETGHEILTEFPRGLIDWCKAGPPL
jgi:Xaa-Pro aminopeptidase